MIAIYVRRAGRLVSTYSVCEDCVGDTLDEIEAEHGQADDLVLSIVDAQLLEP